MSSPAKVAITGASGFIGGSITRRLLAAGHEVNAIVRDPSSKTLAHLHHMSSLHPSCLTLVHVPDLTVPSPALTAAFESCKTVYHVANPIGAPSASLSDEDFIAISTTAVDVVLRAAHAAGATRVVLTASMVSVCGSQAKKDPAHVYTEADWNDDCESRYSKAKTRAEEAAWETAKSVGLELAVINPSLVLGPALPCQAPRSSNEYLRRFASGEALHSLQPGCFGIVHIDDVVEAHIKAGEALEATGERFLCTLPDQYATLEICVALKKHFPFLKVPTEYAEGVSKDALRVATRKPSSDNSKLTKLIGRPLLSFDRAIIDGICSMVTYGSLKIE